MKLLNYSFTKGSVLTITLLLITASSCLYGQGEYFYRVYLKDKGKNVAAGMTLSSLVSLKAIERRNKSGITEPDFRDLPVWKDYLYQISSKGLFLHCTSKWMNTALFRSQSPVDPDVLLDLPFVSEVKIVKSPGIKSSFTDKLDFSTEVADLPPFDRPVTMVNGYPLHNSGFTGTNVLIAVLDGGFTNSDQITSLTQLRNRNGIKHTYDFVNNSDFVYNGSTHGTAVLSILAGNIENYLAGTAPGSDYLLLRTEDTGSEFPCEEDFWIAGAEFADSLGADIISTSLGYYNFDDPALNYKYSDLDGNTAFITKGADIAASKGILVVCSAGNERNKTWGRILFPSDGDSVLASGAVDGNNIISGFSSAGPSADGRIKPDIVTMGVSVPLQTDINTVSRGNGTSFSCPVLSGMSACLLEAVPNAGNYDIIEALRLSADRYSSPDSLYGYGVPDMVMALIILQNKLIKIPEEVPVAAPNPTTGDFELLFREVNLAITIEIFTMSGTIIYRKEYPEYAGRTIRITELRNRDQGIYFIRSITNKGISVQKVIKVSN